MAYINRENASELARKGNAIRWEEWRRSKQEQAIPLPVSEPQAMHDAISLPPLGDELMRVQKQLVSAMIGEKDAAEVSKLARALRDVRETYHLVTGQAKPGTQGIVKPDRRSRQPQVQSAPEPDDTPQQVVPTPNPTAGVNGTEI